MCHTYGLRIFSSRGKTAFRCINQCSKTSILLTAGVDHADLQAAVPSDLAQGLVTTQPRQTCTEQNAITPDPARYDANVATQPITSGGGEK